MASNKTIRLKQYTNIEGEAIANAAITPGHLIEVLSTGKVRKHATAGGAAPERMFAFEDELQGKEISDAYAQDALVKYGIFRSGDIVNARLADGENVAIGDKLESNGDGTLRKVDADSSVGSVAIQSVIGIATEAVDMSGSAGVDPSGLIAVRIL